MRFILLLSMTLNTHWNKLDISVHLSNHRKWCLFEQFNRRLFVFVLTGSPFNVKVTGEGRIRESITRRQKAASVASVGSVCDLNLKIPGKNTHTLVLLVSPSHCPVALLCIKMMKDWGGASPVSLWSCVKPTCASNNYNLTMNRVWGSWLIVILLV